MLSALIVATTEDRVMSASSSTMVPSRAARRLLVFCGVTRSMSIRTRNGFRMENPGSLIKAGDWRDVREDKRGEHGTRFNGCFWANYLLRSGVTGLSCEDGLAAGCIAFDRCRYRGTFSLGAVSSAQIQPGTGHALRLCVAGWPGLEKLNRFPRAQGRTSANHRQIPVTWALRNFT